MIPRIRGKVGQAESDDPKYHGKWFFELFLTTLGGGEWDSLGEFGPFESEELAQSELYKAAQMASDECARRMNGGIPGEYIDMKDNQRKKWK